MSKRPDGADAFALAFRYLSRRERTVSEMREHLLGRELSVAAVEEVIEELSEQGYLDDARYARVFAQDKRELEQWGSERIRQALLARGIDRELVDETLAGEDDEAGRATASSAERSRCCAGGSPARRATAASASARSACCCARATTPSSRSTRFPGTRRQQR